MSRPFLVDTDIASTFVVKCRNQPVTSETLTAAREHIYYLAKKGYITRHGGAKRGQARWDLKELAKPYGRGTTFLVP